LRVITRFLETLKVKVNKDKSKVVPVQESSFLGFTFKGKKLTATVKAVTTFKHRLKRLTGRSWGISMKDRYRHVQVYVTGWMNYFGIGMRYNDIMELDHWLRRRIRMCYLKQWGRARKRIGELIKLGSPKHQAILTGLSRKGYWHLAKTYATNSGLSKQYLEDQGLVSLRTLWIGIHYPATAR
jgi:RNA-directed DNA polymerase